MPTEPPSPELEPPPIHSQARLEDVCSIDAIINAVYEAVSFTDSAGPDEARLRSLVCPDIRLQKVLADGRLLVGDIDSYLASVRERIAEGGLGGFNERELFRRTEVYGGIAQVFTTYVATMTTAEGDRSVRGINSMQLRNDGGRWWVLSILWTDEEEGEPIPSAYLPRS
ncbi:MAG: nuclear transport factor 2 family protein [Myxococcales bacterium]|nr:nuclear transport factor 2 family protein [Myxococcales bacterium]